MSETLNPKSESLALMPSENQWDTLKNESFAGERNEEIAQAKASAETNSIDQAETAVGLRTFESAQTEETYRPVGEMEKSEIAREYLDLLHSLSDNFTSPEGKSSRVVAEDGTIMGQTYAGDHKFIQNLYQKNGLELDETRRDHGQNSLADSYYENADLDRAHTLLMTDNLLKGEQMWRDSGESLESARADLNNAVNKLEELKSKHQGKSFWGRLKARRDFQRQIAEINQTITQAQSNLRNLERQTSDGNAQITRTLREAYSPDYYYGHHKLDYEHQYGKDAEEYRAKTNEEYNNVFFGLDDPTRQAKIDRAIELRKALKLG